VATFGLDISKFQEPSAMDGAAFVILNVEDPGVEDKVARAHTNGIVWGLYSWVYPHQGSEATTRALGAAELFEIAGYGAPPAGFWLDYEHNGVTVADLEDALAISTERFGVYAYLDMLQHDPGISDAARNHGKPLWIAYYPGADDGGYPADQIQDAFDRHAVLWQYTSTHNTLDRDVVLDEDWWSSWIIGGSGGDDVTPEQDKVLHKILANLEGDHARGKFGYPDEQSISRRVGDVWATLKGAPRFGIQPLIDRIASLLAAQQADQAVAPPDPSKTIGSVTDEELVAELDRRLSV
jgi:hypothetical protein